MAASSLSSAAKGALLPWARGGGLARVLLGEGALATAGGAGGPRRWQSSLPQLDHVDRSDEESGGEIDWDNLGFGLTPTDYMYVMRSSPEDLGAFPRGELCRYGNIELSPSSGVLNYAQGLFEGMKAYRRPGGGGYTLFRPEENARRMQHGAERMCMPAPSVDQFVGAVKDTVLANKRWVPPQGKGALYLRPLLMGSGPILGLSPAPEYTFLIYASPVGNYFKEGLAPINLVVDDAFHRAMPGGTGGVKTIANYAPVLTAEGAGGRQEQRVHGRAVPRLGAQALPRGGLVLQRVRRQGRHRRHAGGEGHHPARDHAQERHRARQGPWVQCRGASCIRRRTRRSRRGVLHRHGRRGGAGVVGDLPGAEARIQDRPGHAGAGAVHDSDVHTDGPGRGHQGMDGCCRLI
ncbi:unnamed protein product [Urochloa humidicola]